MRFTWLALAVGLLGAACSPRSEPVTPREDRAAIASVLSSDRPTTRAPSVITALAIGRSDTLVPTLVIGDTDGVLRAYDGLELIRARHVHESPIVDLIAVASAIVSVDQTGDVLGWRSDLGQLAWRVQAESGATSVAMSQRWLVVAGQTGLQQWQRDPAGAPVDPQQLATGGPALAVALADDHLAAVERIGGRLEVGLYDAVTLSVVDRIAEDHLLADVGFDRHGRLVTWHAKAPSLRRWSIAANGQLERPATATLAKSIGRMQEGDMPLALAFDQANDLHAVFDAPDGQSARHRGLLAVSLSLFAWAPDWRSVNFGPLDGGVTRLSGYVEPQANDFAHGTRAQNLIVRERVTGRRFTWSVATAELHAIPESIDIAGGPTTNFGWMSGQNVIVSADARRIYAHASRLQDYGRTIMVIDTTKEPPKGGVVETWAVPPADAPGVFLNLVSIEGREHLVVQPLVERAGELEHAYLLDAQEGPSARIDLPAAGVPIASPSGRWLALASLHGATLVDLLEPAGAARTLRCTTDPAATITLEQARQPIPAVVVDDHGRLGCFVEAEDQWSLVIAGPSGPERRIELGRPNTFAMTSAGLLIAHGSRIELVELDGSPTTIAELEHPVVSLSTLEHPGVVAALDDHGLALLRTDGSHLRIWFGQEDSSRWPPKWPRRAAIWTAADGEICWLHGTAGELWIPPEFAPAIDPDITGIQAFVAGRPCHSMRPASE
jgi:hypothetical protein